MEKWKAQEPNLCEKVMEELSLFSVLPADLHLYLAECYFDLRAFLAARLVCKCFHKLCSLERYRTWFITKVDDHEHHVSFFVLPNKLKHGEYKVYYDNGQLHLRYWFLDGKLNGLCESWYLNGGLLIQQYKKDDVGHGECKYWYGSGRIRGCSFYVNGKLEGDHKQWYDLDSGQLKEHGFYKDGAVDGVFKSWYETGQLKTCICYSHDRFNGPMQRWSPTGELLSNEMYIDAVRQ
jgi:antitoxin component YwqK of YwqJK toxin-antitoxin module